eukprot:TRINITY_DN6920_c0_g1_i1.p1 TRINITY_DN6920_c0_g1~~TRINITY_DN6920_c0_g1_i1.p1  ORF type:complete len:368 (-),score=64.01 TRINITY_DN6920_c0_g1_i1:292-1395(-)
MASDACPDHSCSSSSSPSRPRPASRPPRLQTENVDGWQRELQTWLARQRDSRAAQPLTGLGIGMAVLGAQGSYAPDASSLPVPVYNMSAESDDEFEQQQDLPRSGREQSAAASRTNEASEQEDHGNDTEFISQLEAAERIMDAQAREVGRLQREVSELQQVNSSPQRRLAPVSGPEQLMQATDRAEPQERVLSQEPYESGLHECSGSPRLPRGFVRVTPSNSSEASDSRAAGSHGLDEAQARRGKPRGSNEHLVVRPSWASQIGARMLGSDDRHCLPDLNSTFSWLASGSAMDAPPLERTSDEHGAADSASLEEASDLHSESSSLDSDSDDSSETPLVKTETVKLYRPSLQDSEPRPSHVENCVDFL